MPPSPRRSTYAADPTARGYLLRPNPPPSGVQKDAPEISKITACRPRRYTPETGRLRVGQQGTLSYIWSERGSRPSAVRDDRHDSAWLFGAVCPQRAVGAAIVMPWVSSEVMSLHLAEIDKQVSPGVHGVLVCDGAGWHQPGERLRVPNNVTLLRLPPYAPELNPVENVWAYLRGNMLSMRVWDTYEQIVEDCCKAWNAFIQDVERVVSITTRQWATVIS